MDHHLKSAWTAEPTALGTPELVVIARSMIAARRALAPSLPKEMIHDPALDFLLNLFVFRSVARLITDNDLVAVTTVGPSVGKRWINALEQYGFVEYASEFVALTDRGVEAIVSTLHSVARSQWHLDSEP